MSTATALVKPRLRGVSHFVAFFFAMLGGVWLVQIAPTSKAATSAALYALTLVAMYGFSALYHRPMWTPAARERVQRLDHSAIYLVIAGTYTPVTLVLAPTDGTRVLSVVWIGAALGVLQACFWVNAPKVLIAVLYVVLGWIGLPFVPAMHRAMGLEPLLWIGLGGVIYSLGALVYARRWPNPNPAVFGFHEIFHLLVIAASVCHFVAVAQIVKMARGE